MSAFPQSVYEFGDWLVKNPAFKRVKLPNEVFWSYMDELAQSLLITPSMMSSLELPPLPVLTWRFRQAMIPESDWYRRDALFPPTIWRDRVACRESQPRLVVRL